MTYPEYIHPIREAVQSVPPITDQRLPSSPRPAGPPPSTFPSYPSYAPSPSQPTAQTPPPPPPPAVPSPWADLDTTRNTSLESDQRRAFDLEVANQASQQVTRPPLSKEEQAVFRVVNDQTEIIQSHSTQELEEEIQGIVTSVEVKGNATNQDVGQKVAQTASFLTSVVENERSKVLRFLQARDNATLVSCAQNYEKFSNSIDKGIGAARRLWIELALALMTAFKLFEAIFDNIIIVVAIVAGAVWFMQWKPRANNSDANTNAPVQ